MASAAVAPARLYRALNDKELSRRFASRPLRALFDEAYHRHRDQIYHVCYSFVRNQDDAEDMVSQTFLKAWKGRKGFRADAKFSTWLHRIAVNECLMFIRSKSAFGHDAPTISLDAAVPNTAGDDFVKPDVPLDPRTLDRMVDHQQLQRALLRLSDGQREVFDLYFYKQHTIEEIQKKLKLSEPAVKSRIFHGRQKVLRAFGRLDTAEMT